nr:hypothetical protein [Tanacetum cinerariifolium]
MSIGIKRRGNRKMRDEKCTNKIGDVDINTLAIEKYLELTRGNQAPVMVKPETGNNVNFEINRADPWNDTNSRLESIQNMVDHSQKWHDGSSNRRTSNGSSDGIVAITSKLDSLVRDMKKL